MVDRDVQRRARTRKERCRHGARRPGLHRRDPRDEHPGHAGAARLGEARRCENDAVRDRRVGAEALLPRLDHEARAGRPLRARQRSSRLREGLELELRAALVPLEGELDQTAKQLVVRNAGCVEQLGVDTRRREARNGVQLVDDDLIAPDDEAVDASHPLALRHAKRLDRDPLHLFDHGVREVRRDDEVHAALLVLRRVVVPLVSERDDLARDGRDRLAVAEHADFDLDPVEEVLHEHLVVVAECQQHRIGELALVVSLRDPDRRAESGRLDEAREPEGVLHRTALAERDVPRDGEPAVPQHLLEEVLVHAESRSRDAGADVRDNGELEQSLDGAVLPERAVQDRQHDVDGAESGRGVRRWDGQRFRDRAVLAGAELPAAVATDCHRDDVIALGIERLEYRAGRGQRDVVLGRAAARQDGDPGARHYGGPGVVGAPNLPTAIVTTLPGAAWVPPGGSWVWTIPSWLGSVTGWVTMCTPKPEALSCAWASFCESVVTSGTVDVVGPLATVRMMIAPGGCRVPAVGVMPMTVSFGWSDLTSVRLTANPFAWRIELAVS